MKYIHSRFTLTHHFWLDRNRWRVSSDDKWWRSQIYSYFLHSKTIHISSHCIQHFSNYWKVMRKGFEGKSSSIVASDDRWISHQRPTISLRQTIDKYKTKITIPIDICLSGQPKISQLPAGSYRIRSNRLWYQVCRLDRGINSATAVYVVYWILASLLLKIEISFVIFGQYGHIVSQLYNRIRPTHTWSSPATLRCRALLFLINRLRPIVFKTIL